MTGEFYTHALWRTKEGEAERFVEAWKALAEIFAKLPGTNGHGTLIQSIADPALFYSFGPWESMEAIEAMRRDPDAQRAIQGLRELCDEALPGSYRLVIEVGG